jgi:hypothetical protein
MPGMLAAMASSALAQPAGCKTESALEGRKDVVFCEPWENPSWWRNGYLKVASTTQPRAAAAPDVERTSIVNTGCVSGSCLKVEMRARESGALAIHWPLSAAKLAPEALYLRYYIKLAPNFNPDLCSAKGERGYGTGGKFPGLADVRTWPEEQCGNGGAFADGINCWSMRAYYRNCSAGERVQRHECKNPKATTRFGSYLYYYKQDSYNNAGIWDQVEWGQGYADPARGFCKSPRDIGACGTSGNHGQLENDKWYEMEMYVKMNTPGKPDGVIRGWVDGNLAYEKTNMIWRIPGHDKLHVRTIWLNVHAGGEYVGLCETSAIYLDQLVAATERIGSAKK